MVKRSPIRDFIQFVSMASTISYCLGLTSYLSPYATPESPGYSPAPTMLGLTAIGVVTAVFMVIFLIRAGFYYLGSPKGADDKHSGATSSDATFDADDALARYLARAENDTVAWPAPTPQALPRSGFGRKPV